MKSTIAIVAYKNDDSVIRLIRALNDTIGEFAIIVVDNNKVSMKDKLPPIDKYLFNQNRWQLAGATNLAVQHTNTEYFVYLCGNHIRIYDNLWLADMIFHMDKFNADLGGCLQPFEKRDHIQGGVFIARTETLRELPYDVNKFPFSFMDVYITDLFRKKDKKVINIPSVHSIMGKYVRSAFRHKIVHAHDH